jgi:hypothetical protein
MATYLAVRETLDTWYSIVNWLQPVKGKLTFSTLSLALLASDPTTIEIDRIAIKIRRLCGANIKTLPLVNVFFHWVSA